MIRLEQGDCGAYLIVDVEAGEDILVQTDYDFPSLASTFGWDISLVRPADHFQDDEEEAINVPVCDHRGTDGTVDCQDCGLKAIDFITAAQEWLDDHIGDEVEDPGYFGND